MRDLAGGLHGPTLTGQAHTVVFRQTEAAAITEALETARNIFVAWVRVSAELQDLLVSTPPSEWKLVRTIFDRLRAAMDGVER